jgi:hypothetical protein
MDLFWGEGGGVLTGPFKIKGRACQHPLSPQKALTNLSLLSVGLIRFRPGRNRENVSFLISARKDFKKSVLVIKCKCIKSNYICLCLVQVAYGAAAGWGKDSRLLPSSSNHAWLDLSVFINARI